MLMVRDLCGKRFTKKVSFEFRVKEWRGDGWEEWRTEGWIEVSIKRWDWFTKWKWKLIPEMRRGILKRAICDLKGRGGRWTSKSMDGKMWPVDKSGPFKGLMPVACSEGQQTWPTKPPGRSGRHIRVVPGYGLSSFRAHSEQCPTRSRSRLGAVSL